MEYNETWIRGRENLTKMMEVLLTSGYQIRIDLDQESENLNGEPSYLVSWVDPRFNGLSFKIVNEDDEVERIKEPFYLSEEM